MDKDNWPIEALRLYKLVVRLLVACGEDEFDVGPGKVGGRNFRDAVLMAASYHYGHPDDEPTILKVFEFPEPKPGGYLPCKLVLQSDRDVLMNYEPATVNKLIAHVEKLIPLDSMGIS